MTGAALWESSCINRSLSALSDVLGALAERRPHVPYRNSKLTHLLQDAIGESRSTVKHCYFTHEDCETLVLEILSSSVHSENMDKDKPYIFICMYFGHVIYNRTSFEKKKYYQVNIRSNDLCIILLLLLFLYKCLNYAICSFCLLGDRILNLAL